MTDKWPTDAMIQAGYDAYIAGRCANPELVSETVKGIYLAMEAARPKPIWKEGRWTARQWVHGKGKIKVEEFVDFTAPWQRGPEPD